MRAAPALAAAALAFAPLIHPARAWTTTGFPARHPSFHTTQRCSAVVVSHVHPAGYSSTSPTATTRTTRCTPTCNLEQLPRRTLKRIVPLRPTAEKWLAHFGQTATERRRRLVDTLAVVFVLYWPTFFASRTILGPLAWRAFYLAAFMQAFLRPLVGSYNRSRELWGAGSKRERSKTRGALFTGRVTKTGLALSSEAPDHRTHFQMLVEDEEGRELLFDVPQVPEYRAVRRGMLCEVVVLSRSAGFSKLTGITEAYLPELDLFVGRFPLLDKRVFWDLLDARKKRTRKERARRDEEGGRTTAVAGRRNHPTRDRLSAGGGGSGRDVGVGSGTAAGDVLDGSHQRNRQRRGDSDGGRVVAGEGRDEGRGAVDRRERARNVY